MSQIGNALNNRGIPFYKYVKNLSRPGIEPKSFQSHGQLFTIKLSSPTTNKHLLTLKNLLQRHVCFTTKIT